MANKTPMTTNKAITKFWKALGIKLPKKWVKYRKSEIKRGLRDYDDVTLQGVVEYLNEGIIPTVIIGCSSDYQKCSSCEFFTSEGSLRCSFDILLANSSSEVSTTLIERISKNL